MNVLMWLGSGLGGVSVVMLFAYVWRKTDPPLEPIRAAFLLSVLLMIPFVFFVWLWMVPVLVFGLYVFLYLEVRASARDDKDFDEFVGGLS